MAKISPAPSLFQGTRVERNPGTNHRSAEPRHHPTARSTMPKRQSTAYPIDVLSADKLRKEPADDALVTTEGNDKPAARAGWKPHREPTTWKDATTSALHALP